MAESASQQGSTLYKDGRFEKAQVFFRKASTLDKNEPKHPSNLSAALYELGQYVDCISAIQLSWERLLAQNGNQNPVDFNLLAIKLATRFAKAKINGVASNVISLHKKKKTVNVKMAQFETEIDAFAASFNEETDNKIKGLQAVWRQWRSVRDDCARHSSEACQMNSSAAASRLRRMPIYKSATDPTAEYFRFGHDQLQSMMSGINGSPDDDYTLDIPSHAHQHNWSLMFGGSGDARHVFSTLIHLADIANISGDGSQRNTLSVHMTLIDIHPAAQARVVLVFELLRQILSTRFSDDKTRRTELHATLFYMYTTLAIPEYCRQILMTVARKLAQDITNGTFTLSKWIYVNEKSMPAILDHLLYWSKPLDKSTEVFFPTAPPAGSEKVQYRTTQKSPFCSRGGYWHPALAKVVEAFPKPSEEQYAAAVDEVQKTWHPNPTLFDLSFTEFKDYENGYPIISSSPFDTTASFAQFSKAFGRNRYKPSSDRSSFVARSHFFEMVVDAFWELLHTLKIEIIVEDAITTLPKLFAGELGERPKSFPTKYSRMFLSNECSVSRDYTQGALNTAVHLVQHLETDAIVVANCLLNTGNFQNIGEYCYNYTLLRAEDLPRFLGCKIVDPHRPTKDDIALQKLPLPRPLDQLATKQELHTWLAHLLLCTICNGKPRMPPSRIDLPNNTNAFLHVLVHLHRVGFPAHWIGDFVQSILSNNLITTVQPYLGQTPVPLSESNNRKPSRKVNLEPWQAEFEVVLVPTLPTLPFSVSLPPDYPTYSDISTFRAKTQRIDLARHPKAYIWGSLMSPSTKALGLMFYEPASSRVNGTSVEDLANSISSIIEGKCNHNVQILLAQERGDLWKGEVSWKMSRQRYEKMKSEGWFMAAHRTDLNAAASLPVSASNWMEV